MKIRTTLLIAFTLCNAILFAQIQRGTWLLDGNVNATTELNNNAPTYRFGKYPSAGYFLSNNWLVGMGIGGGYAFGSSDEYKFNSSGIYISPFIRYYFPTAKNKIQYFLNVNPTLSFYHDYYNRTGFDKIQTTGSQYDLRLTTGVDYFIRPTAALECRIGYIGGYSDEPPSHSLGFTVEPKFFFAQEAENTEVTSVHKNSLLTNVLIYGTWSDITGFNDVFFEINPTMGYFLTNRFVLGSGLILGFSNQNSILELQPFARYYFGAQNIRFQPFAMLNANTRFQLADKSSEPSFFNLDANAGIGADFFLTQNVALEGLLKFSGNQIEDETFNRNFLNFNIGFQFFLNE